MGTPHDLHEARARDRVGSRAMSADPAARLRAALLTREYPPEVYGGAGVHVEYLARELRRLADVRVHCFGAPRDEAGVSGDADPPPGLVGADAALRTMGGDLGMGAGAQGTGLVHSHTR